MPEEIGTLPVLERLLLARCVLLQRLPQHLGTAVEVEREEGAEEAEEAGGAGSGAAEGEAEVAASSDVDAAATDSAAQPESTTDGDSQPPKGMRALRHLDVSGCAALIALPDLSELPELTVALDGCHMELSRMWESGGRRAFNVLLGK